jgi:hypothetical protein
VSGGWCCRRKRRERRGKAVEVRRRTRSTWLRLQKVHSLGEGQITPRNPRPPYRQGFQPKPRKECRFQHQGRPCFLVYRDHQRFTLSEGAKASYAELIKTVRGKIPLAEVSIETVRICKTMTGAIIVEPPPPSATKTGKRRPLWRHVLHRS